MYEGWVDDDGGFVAAPAVVVVGRWKEDEDHDHDHVDGLIQVGNS